MKGTGHTIWTRRLSKREHILCVGILALVVIGADCLLADEPSIELLIPGLQAKREFAVAKLQSMLGLHQHLPAALATAVLNGDTDGIRHILDRGVSINAADENGITPVMLSAAAGNAGAFRLLVALGADTMAKSAHGNSVMMLAIFGMNDHIVEYLLGHNGSVAGNSAGFTPLMAATFIGRDDWAQRLLARGASVNDTDYSGHTAMMIACAQLRFGEWSTLRNGKESMHYLPGSAYLHNMLGPDYRYVAVRKVERAYERRDRRRIIDVLLAAGATLDPQTDNGETALMSAVRHSTIEEVGRLLNAGAFVDQRDRMGRTALWHLVDAWQRLDEDSGIEKLNMLLAYRADINAADNDGNTVMWAAVMQHDQQLIRRLFSAGARSDVSNRRGETPLMAMLAAGGDMDEVRILIEQGADVTARDKAGTSVVFAFLQAIVRNQYSPGEPHPMHWSNDEEQLVRLLCARGADLTVADNSGETPLGWAANNGYRSMVRVILENINHMRGRECSAASLP